MKLYHKIILSICLLISVCVILGGSLAWIYQKEIMEWKFERLKSELGIDYGSYKSDGFHFNALNIGRIPIRDDFEMREVVWIKQSPEKPTVIDLTPLAGMRIKELVLSGVKVTDLSPLKGMTLEILLLNETNITDLASLEGMPLFYLNLRHTKVTDLSPLKKSPIEQLNLGDTLVKDLSALKGMPLKKLWLNETKVEDLSPLKGLPLTFIDLAITHILDLTPLKGMSLTYIDLANTQIVDLSPLKGMPLKRLWLQYTPANKKPLPQFLIDSGCQVYRAEVKLKPAVTRGEILKFRITK